MDLYWKDQPFKELVRLAWPMTVSMLSYSVMTLVDTLLLGHVGRAELAGVGLAGMSSFVLLCFSFGLLQGAKVLVSQAIGANRPEEGRAYLGAALSFAIVIGVLTVGVGQIAALFIGHLASTEAAGEAARTYMRLRILGAPLVLAYAALREVRQAEGDSRTPMVATVAANVVNTSLAVFFIFVLKKGVAGAACATLVAHAVEAGMMVPSQHARGWGFSRMRRAHVVELMRVGIATGLQFALEVGAFATLTMMISLFSEVEMASHQIALQVIHFSFLPVLAVAEAAAVLSGQAVGADRFELVNRISRLALKVCAVYAMLSTITYVLAAGAIAGQFTTDSAVIARATTLLHIAAVFQLIDAANIIARSTLRGVGDVRFSAVVGVITSWLCTPTLTWILGKHYGFGAAGGWIGLCLEIFVTVTILWWRLERRGWTRAAALSRERVEANAEAGAAGYDVGRADAASPG
jgi:MATE family multidrug resistance protein